MQVVYFSVRWERDARGEINWIPDDGLEIFGINESDWTAKGPEHRRELKREIMSAARQMYATHTGDENCGGLRFDPKIWLNYYFDHSGGVGLGALLILFKQNDNGNSLRMRCDLDHRQMLSLVVGTEEDKNTRYIVRPEIVDKNGRRINSSPKPMTRERAEAFVMPFGKHAGKKLSEIPTDYLEWFYQKARESHPKIAELGKIIVDANSDGCAL